MKSLSREKLALLIFAVLIVGGLGVSLFYISAVSQPLNVAATNIDDATGNLDGYTAVVYKGLVNEKQDQSQSAAGAKGSASTELNRKAQSAETHADGEVTASDALNNKETSQEDTAAKTVEEVRQEYRDKGASVFELNVGNPAVYNTRSVLQAGNYTFAMIPIDETTARTSAELEAYIKKRVKTYELSNIDFIVLVVSSLDVLNADVPDASTKKGSNANSSAKDKTSQSTSKSADSRNATADSSSSAALSSQKSFSSSSTSSSSSAAQADEPQQIALNGVDIVISTKDEGLNPGGVFVDGIFYDDAVLTSEVGTLLISPSKVISAKDIS